MAFCDSNREPIWIPDLAALLPETTFHRNMFAAGQSVSTVKTHEKSKLYVQGIRCDEIIEVIGAIPEYCPNHELRVAVVAVLRCGLGTDPASWSQEQLEMLAKALTAGEDFESTKLEYNPTAGQITSALEKWAASGLSKSKDALNTVEDRRYTPKASWLFELQDSHWKLRARQEGLPSRRYRICHVGLSPTHKSPISALMSSFKFLCLRSSVPLIIF
jgi:hypothetical protein